jgi:hypothetical protein
VVCSPSGQSNLPPPPRGVTPLPRAARSAALCRLLRRPAPSVPPSSAGRDLALHQMCTNGGTPHSTGARSWASRQWVCRPQRPRLGSWARLEGDMGTWPRERDMASISG